LINIFALSTNMVNLVLQGWSSFIPAFEK